MRSIRGRLVLGTVASTAAIVLVAGLLLDRVTADRLWRAFDDSLVARARLLASLVEWEVGDFEFEIDYRSVPEFARSERPEYFEIWAQDGRSIVRSPSLGAGGFDAPQAQAPVVTESLVLPDGRAGRACIVAARARDGSTESLADYADSAALSRINILVAKETAEIERELGAIRALLLALGGVVTLLTTYVLVVVVQGGLAPLRRFAAEIAGLDPERLSGRIALPRAPAELAHVVETTNRLLDRLEGAIERERSFTADVAHELRTPLSGVRTTLEVALSRARDSETYRQALADCLGIAVEMQQMTGNLLSLARLDRGQIQIERMPVPLEPLVRECWQPLAGRAEGKRAKPSWSIDPSLSVETDREILRQVLANVLGNAVDHVDDGGTIEIECRRDREWATIRVANSGSQVYADDVGRIFDRFWRGDAARRSAGVHAGLGLSLVRRFVQLLGGEVTATSTFGGSFALLLSLPTGSR